MSLRDKAFSIITHTKNGYIGGYYVEDRGTRYDGGLVVAIEDAEAAVEAAAEQRGREAEREGCATLAETIYPDMDWPLNANFAIRERIARAIRARGEQETGEK